MAKKQEVNVPLAGMARGKNPMNLEPQEYIFAKNVNFQNESGDIEVLKTEASNLLSSKFKSGFKVVGFKNDITTEATYFFLTNPITKVSEFGVIYNNQNEPYLGDTEEIDCAECDKRIKLSEPLENQTQSETQQYITLLEDSCNNCLNLSIEHPIKEKNIIIKNEKCGNVLYFTDNYNEPRFIKLDDLDSYKFTGETNCGVDDTVSTCLACDKLRMFPLHREAKVQGVEIVLGGRLPLGSYEFAFVYCDNLGNEISEYFGFTQPINIFDENTTILEQSELNQQTNYAIKVTLSDLDQNYKYYKAVAIQTTSLDGATRYFEEGVHPVTDNTILYTTEQGKQTTSINKLLLDKPNIKKFKGLLTSNKLLIGYGTEVEKEWNLQPVVNLLGNHVKWQTQITTEEYYKTGTAKKTYLRDEVYPLSIGFKTNYGYKTAKFPLIGRPATSFDLEEVDNKDTQSITASVNKCYGVERTKRWQFYNTASEEGSFPLSEDIEYTEVTETLITTTIVPSEADTESDINIDSIPSGTVSITNASQLLGYVDLKTYLQDYKDSCPDNISTICDYLEVSQYDSISNPPELGSCSEPTNTINEVDIVRVNNEQTTFIPKDIEDYGRVRPTQSCLIYQQGENNTDEDFSARYALRYFVSNPTIEGTLTERINTTYSDSCDYATDVIEVPQSSITTVSLPPVVHPHYGVEMETGSTVEQKAARILDYRNAIYTETFESRGNRGIGGLGGSDAPNFNAAGLFTSKIHKGALWYRIDVENKEKIILEISRLTDPGRRNWRLDAGVDPFKNTFVRMHLFSDCSSSSPISGVGGIIDLSEIPDMIELNQSVINQSSDGQFLYLVFDLPISESRGLGDNGYIEDEGATKINTVVTIPMTSCFTVNTREEEYSRVDVTYDSIDIEKKQDWRSVCTYQTPVVSECNLIPNKYGKFGYIESTENYPDNQELYDSSILSIQPSDFTNEDSKQDFKEAYTEGLIDGNYILKEDTNFSCKPIRHFRLPDNEVAPFMSDQNQARFSSSLIFPLGITIDEDTINDYLNIAVKNSLITQKQRDSIVEYEIYRGDRTLDKGIVAKGVMYDMYKYTEDDKEILYSNYPYNDLGDDNLNYETDARTTFIKHPYSGNSNHNYTLHSPELQYLKPTLGSEIKIEGALFGNSRGAFDEVEGHSKWILLGSDARSLASTLATAEVVAEATIATMDAFSRFNPIAGVATTVFPGAAVASTTIAVASALTAVLFKYGRYKYQWLEIFENLGKPENFAYYYSSEGYYNVFKPTQINGEKLRSLNLAKYLKDERKIFVDKRVGDKVEINNYKREESVYINVGEDFNIVYSDEYKNYDNNQVQRNLSSRYYLSESGSCAEGRSKEVERNIASLYVSMKNYLPSQYGNIDSIKWLSTGHSGNLTNTTTPYIFGGDTYIARDTFKRKIPLFLRDAFDLANKTPFNYKNQSNIGQGTARFYGSYRLPSDINFDRGFPTISNDYSFDCLTGDRGFYVKEPSKFYLYYYGIPNYLVETSINTNYRYGKKEPKDNFYPNVGDYLDWTQENLVSIKERNSFFYNFVYSKNVTQSISRTLPSTYNKKEYDCRYDSPNGGYYTIQDNSENGLYDPWLVFRPLDLFNFSSGKGDLISMFAMENEQVAAVFEDGLEVHNAVDTTVDDGKRPETQVLGNGGLFARRPRTFSETDLGKWGTQLSEHSSNEFGHFYADPKRGTITRLYPASSNIKEISKYGRGNKPTWMYQWFKEHLPFKILKTNPEVDIDNPYNGIGLSIGYDDRYKRIFFTKKDYVAKNDLCYNSGKFYSYASQQETITQYENDGYTYNGVEECALNFSKEVTKTVIKETEVTTSLPSTTDIYAIFDTTSMQVTDGIAASEALNVWFDAYTTDNPDFEGNLYIIPYGIETYLDYLWILQQTNYIPSGGTWSDIAILPPNYNTQDWIPPKDILLLAFVDETQGGQVLYPQGYHASTISQGFENPTQPSDSFFQGYLSFKEQIENNYDFFRGVVYPIVQNTAGLGGALVLQTLAAMKGRTLTQSEIDETGTTVDVSLLLSENPYENTPIPNTSPQQYLEPLENFGWFGQYDKVSPASEVFTSQQFQDDLNNLINQGGTETEIVEEEVEITETEIVKVPLEETKLGSDDFEDASWTVAYDPLNEGWISYYDFKPNYYISHNNFFQTGLNDAGSKFGLWSHNLTNKSFRVFYGEKFNSIVEYGTKNDLRVRNLNNIKFKSEARRYHNEYDFAYSRDITWDTAIISSTRENTGKLKLIPQKTLSQISKYPKKLSSTVAEILITNTNELFNFDYLYNRVKKENNNQPHFNWDINKIERKLNPKAVSFYGKNILEPLTSSAFNVYLEHNGDTRYEVDLQWTINEEYEI